MSKVRKTPGFLQARLTWSEKGVLMLWELSTETVGAEPRFGSWAEALLMARGQGRHGGALMLPRLTYDGVVGGAVHLDEGQTPSAIYAANGATAPTSSQPGRPV